MYMHIALALFLINIIEVNFLDADWLKTIPNCANINHLRIISAYNKVCYCRQDRRNFIKIESMTIYSYRYLNLFFLIKLKFQCAGIQQQTL
jgi:hypothetical protein